MTGNLADKIDVYKINDVELRALWVLEKLSQQQKRATSHEISNYLIETCGISMSRQAVTSALSRAKECCHKNKDGYKIMHQGRQKLREIFEKSGDIIILQPNKQYTAKVILKDIFSALKGQIFICDPYVDVNTLDLLYANVPCGQSVKILTQHVIEKRNRSFKNVLTELNEEGYNISIRSYGSSELHDRYLIDEEKIWHSGNSLNCIGKKESMFILLGPDHRQSMLQLFNQRWKNAISL